MGNNIQPDWDSQFLKQSTQMMLLLNNFKSFICAYLLPEQGHFLLTVCLFYI